MGKDMDRDILEKVADLISECKTLIETINDNKYVAHITEQPTNISGPLGDTVYFTITANNVKKYQWQYLNVGQTTWRNTTLTGYNTNSLRVAITEARDGMGFRCVVTGLDNAEVASNGATLSVTT